MQSINISPSRIDSFLGCSFKSLLMKKGYKGKKSMSLIMGATMHYAIKDDMLARLEGELIEREFLIEHALALFEENLEHYGFPIKDQEKYQIRENAVEYGQEFLRMLMIEYCKVREAFKPIEVERKYSVKYKFGDEIYEFTGIIDLLCEFQGKKAIVDFKSRTKLPYKQDNVDIQFGIYKDIVSRAMGEDIGFYAVFLSKGNHVIYEYDFSSELLKRIHGIIASLCLAITKEVYLPAMQDDWRCAYCGFLEVCPYTLHHPDVKKEAKKIEIKEV